MRQSKTKNKKQKTKKTKNKKKPLKFFLLQGNLNFRKVYKLLKK